MKTPKFAEGQKVTLSYSDWDGDAYPVEATVRKSEFFERPEGGRPGFHYMLEIADPSKLDKTDRCALEWPERNLYGWVRQSALSSRDVSEDVKKRP